MTFMHIYYPESKFGEFTDIDGTIVFYTRVNALAQPSSVVLDLGCRAIYPFHDLPIGLVLCIKDLLQDFCVL